MNKPLVVREYDTISENSINKSKFNELVKFIETFNSADNESDVLDFCKIVYKRGEGATIVFKNYVGLIQISKNFQIEILPKIDFVSSEKDTKEIFLKMLRSLKNFMGKVFTTANLNLDRMSLYEIFINMYVQEVRYLVKKGIKSAYTKTESNLNFYKGRLIVNEHIKYNIAHKERFYIAYDEYSVNRAENRLNKSTLFELQKLTGDAKNAKEIRQLLTAFELVDLSQNYEKDFSSIVIDRSTKEYENLMRWSEIFLKNKSFTTFYGKEMANSMLFPMEKLFEAYVAKNLKNFFEKDNWHVSIQHREYYLFDKLNGEDYKKFALIPDIVAKKNERVIIFDTKWKRLIDDKNKNYGISPTDMYQMYAYSKKYKTSEIWLLYPMNEDMKAYKNNGIVFESDDNTRVSIFFVDIGNGNIEGSMNDLKLLL